MDAQDSRWREVCGRHGVHCHICLGDGFHPSSCTTPAETVQKAGSAREPKRHSMCTSDAWRHKDSMRQCRGDLYSEELEEGAASEACLVTWLQQSGRMLRRKKQPRWQNSLLHDLQHFKPPQTRSPEVKAKYCLFSIFVVSIGRRWSSLRHAICGSRDSVQQCSNGSGTAARRTKCSRLLSRREVHRRKLGQPLSVRCGTVSAT